MGYITSRYVKISNLHHGLHYIPIHQNTKQRDNYRPLLSPPPHDQLHIHQPSANFWRPRLPPAMTPCTRTRAHAHTCMHICDYACAKQKILESNFNFPLSASTHSFTIFSASGLALFGREHACIWLVQGKHRMGTEDKTGLIECNAPK